MAIEVKKVRIYMNKPIYVGQSVLDISKCLMYELWYNYLLPKYGDRVRLCYMDTDSFIFRVETNDFYADILPDLNNWFDTSKIDEKLDGCMPIGVNARVIGKFKDEASGKIITEFVTLASKLYAYKDADDNIEKKNKGVKKCAIKAVLNCNHYMNALLLNKTIRGTQQRFKSVNHTIYTEEVNKVLLSRKDDKRIQSFDGITTYLYGINSDLLNKLETIVKNKPIQLYCFKK